MLIGKGLISKISKTLCNTVMRQNKYSKNNLRMNFYKGEMPEIISVSKRC